MRRHVLESAEAKATKRVLLEVVVKEDDNASWSAVKMKFTLIGSMMAVQW